MDHHRKLAYNYLLYWAMLDIRGMEWIGRGRFRLRWLFPGYWHTQLRRIRYSGALADALHNLALSSAYGYDGFDEDQFWKWFGNLSRYNSEAPAYYRSIFDRHLKELEDGALTPIPCTKVQPTESESSR